jgi:hypothetical protein
MKKFNFCGGTLSGIYGETIEDAVSKNSNKIIEQVLKISCEDVELVNICVMPVDYNTTCGDNYFNVVIFTLKAKYGDTREFNKTFSIIAN